MSNDENFPQSTETPENLLGFIHRAEALKRELRHSWLSDGRHESVAEHTWSTCLLAMLLHSKLEQPVDLNRVIQMLVVHDLVEMYAGDVPVFEEGHRRAAKMSTEVAAMERIAEELGPNIGRDIKELWEEFERRDTPESQFAHSIDKIEAQIQHNAADISTWLPAEQQRVFTINSTSKDPFMIRFTETVRKEAVEKMEAANLDVESIKSSVIQYPQ